MKNLDKIFLLLIVLVVSGTATCSYAADPGNDNLKVQNNFNNQTIVSSTDIKTVNQTRTIYVSMKGNDGNSGLTAKNPLKTIQFAINRANPGNTIKVAQGTYNENIVINKNINIIGFSSKNTVINGNNRNRCIIVQPKVDAMITGFTITGGKSVLGAGIYNKGTLKLNDTLIKGNQARIGGGIINQGELYAYHSSFISNSAGIGGGVSNSAMIYMKDCIISSNTGLDIGGGINNNGTFYLLNSVIKSNEAGIGGGISTDGDMQIFESSIHLNTAENGGGVYNNGKLSMVRTKVLKNTAVEGGGIFNKGNIEIFVTNINGNTAENGGGINNYGTIKLYNTQITENTGQKSGGGIYNNSTIYIDSYSLIKDNIKVDVSGNPLKTLT
jgi:hypothetical protein